MKKHPINPIVLTILDGWGHSNQTSGNAIHIANTPTIDSLIDSYPKSYLHASGPNVGLPNNQVGNSEVGHTSIGGGRIIPQDLVRIGNSIEDKSFYDNIELNQICQHVYNYKTQIHLIGLCSDGGVHSHIEHLIALLKLLKQKKINNIFIHFIADGRDTDAQCAKKFLKQITEQIKNLKVGKISTISGRYYAMDRDCRWSRTETFYNILTNNKNIDQRTIDNIIEDFYSKNISDEFIIPTRINDGIIQNNDSIIFFNFRPDRMRQILQAFSKDTFKGFHTQNLHNLQICTFTKYDSTLNTSIAFKPINKTNFLGEIIAKNNLKQLRIAETEKYAHVTYFFNGGVEEPFTGEDRELISSPSVKTYDESPAMSAKQITERATIAIEEGIYSLIVINYANPDMVGHTGNLQSTIQAIETVDKCITQLVEITNQNNGTLIITADHGNAEYMINDKGQPCKSHTNNLVPFILIENEVHKIIGHGANLNLRPNGSLTDIAPTILELLQIEKPQEMTGKTLIEKSRYELRNKVKIL
uniref:2,3-bisphosphoglycerate-independent phosphoglycerate mutase n=1 Tax=Dichotomaria marginata TaxID=268567 RepID=A0A1G4NSK8_9FLOR|nr:Phosphoglycerate mutase [Dichotomaria marginata]SCW21499.1 Phosphoglycerate mutase [Dichotomaria marginata]